MILEYKDHTYRVATDLMRTHAVDAKVLTAKAEKIRSEAKASPDGSWPEADVSPLLWGTMLDLIYAGHWDSAWRFMDEAWPQKVGGKETFRRDFTEQLKTSPYWKAIPR